MRTFRIAFRLSIIFLSWLAVNVSAQDEQIIYPEREVDRPVILPDGYAEMIVNLSYLDTKKFFDKGGESVDIESPDEYHIFLAQLEIDYGMMDWLELGAGIPFYSGQAFMAEGDNLGDLYGIARCKIFGNKARTQELAFDLKITLPTGYSDREMELKDDRYFQSKLQTGDPSADIFPGLSGRLTFKNFALRAGLEYGYRIEGDIKSGIEGMEDVVNFDPGESLSANVDFLYQFHKNFVANIGVDYFQQDANKLDGESLDDETSLFQLKPGIQFQIGENYDIILQAGVPLSGKNQPDAYPVMLIWKNRF